MCARHFRDLEEGPARGIRFDAEKASRAIEFFPDVLRLNGGQFEAKPFILDPSQAFIVGSLFGWLNEDGTRRFRFAYIEQGKGNGKSPLAAGIGLYGLVADGEARAEIYSAATKKDQAAILFRDAVAMVNQSPLLRKALHQSGRGDKVYNLFHPRSNSFFRPISSDEGQSGPRPHFGLIDELHEHRSANVINMMSAGRKWRRQPLIVVITNSGHDRKSVCWEYHELGRQVCAGTKIDDSFFAYICALDEGDDPFKDESCWIKANPLLGVIVEESYLRSEVTGARGLPSKESTTRRLNFCEWTEAVNPLIPRELWVSAAEQFTLEKFRGSEILLGLDLSGVSDLTAAVFVGTADAKQWWIPFFWLPEDGLAEKEKIDKAPYLLWKREGWLRTTPGKVIDKDFVVADIAKIRQQYALKIKECAFDRYRIEDVKAAAKRLGISFEGEGAILPLVEFGQGFVSMGPAVDALESGLKGGTLKQNSNPVLAWNAANVIAVSNAVGERKFDKSQETGRIDGIVAGGMAHLKATQSAPKPTPRIRWA